MKNELKLMILVALTGVLVLPTLAEAGDIQVGRYLTVSNQPTVSQIDLLAQTVQVRFPQSIVTVGDAMGYLLNLSGYSLVQDSEMSEPLKSTLTKPLPIIDREIGPMSLKNALSILIGSAFNLYQDPISRTVNFHLKPIYLKGYLANKRKSGVV